MSEDWVGAGHHHLDCRSRFRSGYVLHKHPERVQKFDSAVGTANVFYPEATEHRCTGARQALLEVDAIDPPTAWMTGTITD